jgi:alanine-glyoxylate transaminase/serine-glyoxylate transaminase/serine-pyruvate transaminase
MVNQANARHYVLCLERRNVPCPPAAISCRSRVRRTCPTAFFAPSTAPTIDHRGPEFQKLGREVLEGIKRIFKTQNPVIIYPASGTGAWEAALVNTLSPRDKVLMAETGHFASLWHKMAKKLSIEVEFIPGDWRRGADFGAIEARLKEDKAHTIKAVCVVHNETSTGATTRIPLVRQAIDNAGHPALLLVDTISSLGSIDYRHDEWGVDVTVGGSQKGLMLPPGLSFNAISPKALAANKSAGCARSFWDWAEMLGTNANGFFPYTPATNLLYGLARGDPHARGRRPRERLRAPRSPRGSHAPRRARLEPRDPLPGAGRIQLVAHRGDDARGARRRPVPRRRAAELRHVARQGLSKLSGKIFRIGHLGDFNDLTLAGTLAGVEMGLELAAVPHRKGGVQAALDYLAAQAAGSVTIEAGSLTTRRRSEDVEGLHSEGARRGARGIHGDGSERPDWPTRPVRVINPSPRAAASTRSRDRSRRSSRRHSASRSTSRTWAARAAPWARRRRRRRRRTATRSSWARSTIRSRSPSTRSFRTTSRRTSTPSRSSRTCPT